MIGMREANLSTAYPVANTITSTSRSVPSAVTMPVGVMRSIGSVTSSTLGRLKVG